MSHCGHLGKHVWKKRCNFRHSYTRHHCGHQRVGMLLKTKAINEMMQIPMDSKRKHCRRSAPVINPIPKYCRRSHNQSAQVFYSLLSDISECPKLQCFNKVGRRNSRRDNNFSKLYDQNRDPKPLRTVPKTWRNGTSTTIGRHLARPRLPDGGFWASGCESDWFWYRFGTAEKLKRS